MSGARRAAPPGLAAVAVAAAFGAANFGPGTVTPISTATNETGPAIRTGASPSAIVITR